MPYSHSSVDEQVVKMMFDNSNFDQNINDSIKALNSLDTKLGAINKTDFSGISNSLSSLANVFTVKGQVMLGVFTRLGSEAVNLGKRIKNSLTQGIRDGLGEYRLIIDSTQTIFQNVKQSGATLDQVNMALDELNDYADKTIYNFAEMTRMIGMFTSAGVSLKKSVSTIKGLANAAALVGANSEKAQMAWHAVSRAMSSGVFSNITWKSLELSNIAGEQFNKVITEVARANKVTGKSGKNIDEMIKKYGSLRLTLSEGWLNKDIFAEAMQIMSKDLDYAALKQKGYTEEQIKQLTEIADSAEMAATQVKTFQQLIDTTKEAIGSGWAQSFRILIGDLERAKELFTRISIVVSDFIDNNAKIRNEVFKEIVEGVDREDKVLFEGLAAGKDSFKQTIENMLATAKTFFKAVQVGFLNIFPVERISVAARKVLDVVQKATRALVLNEEQLGEGNTVLGWDTENIHRVSEAIKDLIRFFRGLASAVDIAWMSISQPMKVIIDRVPFLRNFFENTNSGIIGLVKNLGKFGDKITVVRNAVKDTQIFSTVLEYFLDNVDEIGKKFPVLGFFVNIFKNLKNIVTKIKDGFKSLNIKPLSALFGAFKMVVEATFKILNAIFEVFKSIKDKIDWSFLDKPKAAIVKFMKVLSNYGKGLISFEDVTSRIGKSIKDTFDKVIRAINNLFNKTKLKTNTVEMTKYMSDLKTNTTKVGIKIADIWNKVKDFFAPIVTFFKSIGDSADWTFDGVIKKLGLVAAGAGAAALGISGLIKTFGRIKIVNNLNDLLTSGIDVMKAYQKQLESKMILNIAVAIGILAASMAALSFIPYDKLENGLVIFSGFISVLSLTLTPIIASIARFNESLGAIRKTLTGYDVLNNFVKELGKFGKRVAQGINSKLMGQAAKDFAYALFIITGAIAALTLLFKLDGPATETALKSMTGLIIAFTVAIGGLSFVIALLMKFGSRAKTAMHIFSTFFTLSGVSVVILSIAAAVGALVMSLMALANINTPGLEANFEYFKELLLWVGGIAAVLTLLVSPTGMLGGIFKNSGKAGISGVATIILSVAGSVALISAALSKLADKDPEVLKKVFDYVKQLTITVGIFATLITAIIAPARMFGSFGDSTSKILVAMVLSVAAVVAALHLLGKADPINDSVIETLRMVVIALGIVSAVMVAMFAVVGRANSTFSTGFVNAINKVSIGIAAVIAAIGIMTAGIAALFASLGSVKSATADSNRASNAIIIRLNLIAATIRKSLPAISKTFYSLGQYAGTAFTSFTLGFAENLATTGDAYNAVIIKIVNVVLDILGKALNTLHTRKDDVRRIIKQAIDLIASIITEVINDVFYKGNQFQMKEEDLLKILGFGGLTIGGSSLIVKLASNLNTLSTSAKNLGSIFKWIGGTSTFKPLILQLQAGIRLIGQGKKTVFDLLPVIGKIAFAVAAIALAIGTIIVGIRSIATGLRQLHGEEARYIRSDVTDAGSALKAFFTDADFRLQMFIDGFSYVGEFIANVVMSVVNGIKGSFMSTVWLAWSATAKIHEATANIMRALKRPESEIKRFENYAEIASKKAEEAEKSYKGAYNQIGYDWNNWGAGGMDGDTVIDGAQKYADNVEEASDIVSEAYYDAGVEANESFSSGLASNNPVESAFSWLKNTVTNSTVLEYIKSSLRQVGIDIGGAAAQTVEDIYKNFKVTDIHGNEKTVAISKEYLEIINEEKDALKNLGREEQIRRIKEKAAAKGIQEDETALLNTYAAILLNQEQQAYVTAEGIEAVQNKVAGALASIGGEVLGTQAAAADNYVQDYMNSTMLVEKIMEDNKDKLVGMKKDEVTEFLKQEAIKSGLTEQEAEEAAKHIMAIESATGKTTEELTASELEFKANAFKDETDAFKQMEEAKNALAAASAKKREELALNEYKRKKDAYEKGYVTEKDYIDWKLKNGAAVDEYYKLQNEIGKLEGQYWNKIAAVKKGISTNWANQGLSEAQIADKWNKNISDYAKAAEDAKKESNRSITTTIKQFLDKIKNGVAGDVNLDGWNFATKKGNNDLTDTDTKSAVDAAANLKNDLEAQRADLTPTFDLDQLAADANKANGIVMSSLMAAQNASIADYINKDSELNPFAKDRWQNVYNFTQNNYSPKALSRIDIYRQTQRQISMSRGF